MTAQSALLTKPRKSHKLTSSNEEEFWCLANEVASLSVGKDYVWGAGKFEKIEARFAFMNRSRIYKLSTWIHNRNKVASTITREEAIASMLYEWRELSRHANPENKSFQDWYNGTITLYHGTPFRWSNPEIISEYMELEQDEYRSTSVQSDIAIDFTQRGRARGAFMNTAMKDGWLLEIDISPKQIYFYNNVMHEYECIIKGQLLFTRKTRVVAGQRLLDVE